MEIVLAGIGDRFMDLLGGGRPRLPRDTIILEVSPLQDRQALAEDAQALDYRQLLRPPK
jgi:hypothetical protein